MALRTIALPPQLLLLGIERGLVGPLENSPMPVKEMDVERTSSFGTETEDKTEQKTKSDELTNDRNELAHGQQVQVVPHPHFRKADSRNESIRATNHANESHEERRRAIRHARVVNLEEGFELQTANGVPIARDGVIAFVASEILSERDQSAYLLAKRFLDIVLSLLAIALLSPVMITIAVLIKLQDGGPIFYVHRRVGELGREFTFLKFRSMCIDADQLLAKLSKDNEHADSRTFKMKDDPRITWVGKWLRRTSLDESPQLFNILMGDMTLVGPRPPLPSEVVQYSAYDLQRLAVRPGLTCIWQVSGRSKLPFPEQLEMDLEYIRTRSTWLDLKLMAKTVPAVLKADGAY